MDTRLNSLMLMYDIDPSEVHIRDAIQEAIEGRDKQWVRWLKECLYADIRTERVRQDIKWGGAQHDDQWTAFDWHEMIADYNAWARRMAAMGSFEKARRRYIQIAALAVAAVEALDRHGH